MYVDGSVKCKGCFEIDKEFHKDPSMKIVPIALKEYFVNNIPITETIMNHKNIYDFCLRLKTNSKSTPKYTYIYNNEIKEKTLDRTTRYYISKKGGILSKCFKDGKVSGVNIGYNVTLFNNYVEKEMKDYEIDYSFYINECKKIIDVIEESNQPSLFNDLF